MQDIRIGGHLQDPGDLFFIPEFQTVSCVHKDVQFTCVNMLDHCSVSSRGPTKQCWIRYMTQDDKGLRTTLQNDLADCR